MLDGNGHPACRAQLRRLRKRCQCHPGCLDEPRPVDGGERRNHGRVRGRPHGGKLNTSLISELPGNVLQVSLDPANVTLEPSPPIIGTPHQLFDGGFMTDQGDLVLRFYDVASDGRFLAIERSQGKAPSIVVVQHWDQELNRLAPAPEGKATEWAAALDHLACP